MTFAAYCRNNEILELIKQNKSGFYIYEKIILGDIQHTKEYYKKNKSSINQYSIDGFTPLFMAEEKSFDKVSEYLKSKGGK